MTLVQGPDISLEKDDSGRIDVDFLLPNGVLIPMRIDFFTSLDLIKRVSLFVLEEPLTKIFVVTGRNIIDYFYRLFIKKNLC